MSPFTSLVDWAAGHGLHMLASLAVWATLVLAVAWLAACVLRRSSSAVRYCIWQLGLTGLLILPVLYALLPGVPLGFSLGGNSQVMMADEQPIEIAAIDHPVATSPPPDRTSGSRRSEVAQESIDFLPPAAEPADRPSDRTPEVAAAEIAPLPVQFPLPWPLLLVGAWLLGLLANLLWLAASALRGRRLLGSARPLDDPRFEQVHAELQPRLSANGRVRLMISQEMRIPAVVGFRRPRILLPADCTDWSVDRIRLVLAHELAHVERHDIFWQLVARLSAATYWFHPLVWLALARMRAERERSCDDRVLSAGVQPIDYATGLVDVAAALARRERLAIGGIGMASRGPLEDRLRAILDRSLRRGPASTRVRRGLAIGTAAVVVALGLLRPFSPLPSSAVEPADPKPPAADATPARSIAGTVRDDHGQPIAGATVRLYSAGVRGRTNPINYPYCYDACGPHAMTDQEGRFSIASLNPSLIFHLLFVAAGHKPRFTGEVDPADGRQVDATLDARPLPDDPACVVTGVVVDPMGKPAVGALVDPYSRQVDGRTLTVDLRGIDGLAVTDDAGRFVLVSEKPIESLNLRVEARGAARRNFERVPSASESNRLALEAEASVEGRVVKSGQGVPGVSIAVMQEDQGHGDQDSFLGSFEAETAADGRFSVAGLPAGKQLVVYGIMDSLRDIGAIPTRQFTSAAGATTNLGDLPVEPAHRVAGRLLRAGGKPMPPHLRVRIERPNAWDRTTVESDAAGRFVFSGIPAELVSLSVSLNGWSPLPGFHLSPKNKSFEPLNGTNLRGLVIGDIDDLIVLFEPGEWHRPDVSGPEWRAAAAQYNNAATQPLAGVTADLETPPPTVGAAAKPAEPKTKQAAEPPKWTPKADRPKEVATTGTMHISVVDEAGKPMPGAKLFVGSLPLPSRHYACDANGQVDIELPKMLHLLRVWSRSDGYMPLFAQWWPEQQEDGHLIPEAFTFRMQKGTVIGGIVKDEKGQPIPRVQVEVQYNGVTSAEQMTKRPVFDTWLAFGDAAKFTDAEGRWTLDDVPPGDDVNVSVKLTHPEYISDMSWGDLQREQHVTIQALRAKTAAIVMQRGTAIAGTLTDPDGKPVAGAVVVWGDRPYWEHRPQQEVRSDENGHYQFPPLPTGPMTVTLMAPGWMPELRVVDVAPEIAPVDFHLKPGKTLRIRFVDQVGTPVPEAYVHIERWRGKQSLYNDQHPNVLDTAIPMLAKDGVYQWTWAPDDAVTYRVGPRGRFRDSLVGSEVTLTADGEEHVVAFQPLLHIAGSVTDARTGKPVDAFTIIPVLEFGSDNFYAIRRDAKQYSDGQYGVDLQRTDVAHCLRIESEGYRTAMSDTYRVGQPNPTCDFRLKPATPTVGRVFGLDGKPLAGAIVLLATKTQRARVEYPDKGQEENNESATSDVHGAFAFPAQFERYTVIAMHDQGYAEVVRGPDQSVGELRLAPWAHIEGQLLQAGKPLEQALVNVTPLRPRVGDFCSIEDQLYFETDKDGRFVFDRVRPGKSDLWVHPWKKAPLTYSEFVPLDLKPGQHVTRNFGAGGAAVRGRLAIKGDQAKDIEVRHSRIWLVRKAPGIDPPSEIADTKFNWADGWNDAWGDSPRGQAYLETLYHYHLDAQSDGTFLAGGVPAGDYCLAVRAYRHGDGKKGVLFDAHVVHFQVTAADVAKGSLDLGTVEVDPRLDRKAR